MSDNGDYVMGSPVGDRAFAVTQSGATEWQITDGDNASGYITQTAVGAYGVDVDDSGATTETKGDIWAAVQAFARLTRTVEATPTGRVIASRWQSSGTVGAVLAQFASTGRARLDMLTDDAERTTVMDTSAREEMAQLLRADHGYREPITARSLATAHASEYGDTLASTASIVFADIAENHPHLITDAASARTAFDDIWSAWENEV